MTGILDGFLSPSSAEGKRGFRPQTLSEFFGLRLAIRLGDGLAAQHYSELTRQYSEGQLLLAYRHAIESKSTEGLAKRFHNALAKLARDREPHVLRRCLVGIRVERRSIAVAVSTGERLEYTQVRQLPSNPERALASAAMFVSRIADKFPLYCAALEVIPGGSQVHRAALHRVVASVLTERAIEVCRVSKRELFAVFGYPPLKFRKDLRGVVDAIWPVLEGGYGAPFLKDAVALGLNCQLNRLFNH